MTILTPPPDSPPPATTRGGGPPSAIATRLAGAAGWLAMGIVASKVLGVVRTQLIASLYARQVEADAFNAASRVPTMLFDLLIGGMLTAALVPVLASYARRDREEYWRAASTLLFAAAAVSGVAALAVFVWAAPIGRLLGSDKLPGQGMLMVTQGLQLMAPAVFLFGVVGMFQAVLYSLERVRLPALAMPAYNLAMIVAVLLLRPVIGARALALGVTVGALAQLLILVPGVRDGRWQPVWRHPALRRVLKLYAPIGAGLVVTQLQVGLDTNLAAGAGVSTLTYATNLYQFPHGFIAVAISLAILPRLSSTHATDDPDAYSRTLARGLRTVMALTLPAAVGLAALAEPVTGLIYQHGVFGSADRIAVMAALYAYLVGLPFAAIDWPLNYAFYARQNTWIPALIGVLSIGVYLVVAVTIGPVWNLAHLAPGRLFIGLALAESAKQASHALTMLFLVRRAAGADALRALPRVSLAAGAAALAMGVVVYGLDHVLAPLVGAGTPGWGIRTIAGVLAGGAVYAPLARASGVDEIGWLVHILRARLGLA